MPRESNLHGRNSPTSTLTSTFRDREGFPGTQIHRITYHTNHDITAAAEEGTCRWRSDPLTQLTVVTTYRVCEDQDRPSLHNSGPFRNIFAKEGIQNFGSQQVPRVNRIKLDVKLGEAVYVGDEKNAWQRVHIDEGMEVHSMLFDAD